MARTASAPREYMILRSIVIPSFPTGDRLVALVGLVPSSSRERESGQRGSGEHQPLPSSKFRSHPITSLELSREVSAGGPCPHIGRRSRTPMGRYRKLSRTNREVGQVALGTSGAPIEPLLRRLEPLGEQAFHRVGRPGDGDREVVPRARRNP